MHRGEPEKVVVTDAVVTVGLSLTCSGPKRFDYDADSKTWFCLKEGETSTLHEILQEELSQVFDTEVEVLLEDE